MTDDQINQAIAEACGICHVAKAVPMYKTPDGWVVDCPKFATCLNAMHEAEKTLTDANMFVMAHHIERLVSAHGQHYFHATARQRAEAFLLTLGKWEDK
jgi:cytochrome c553